MKNKNLELVAINLGDSNEVINKYVKEGGFSFPIVKGESSQTGSVFEKYGVQAFPTNYVLDSEGKVVFRAVGFNEEVEEGMRKALADLGVK